MNHDFRNDNHRSGAERFRAFAGVLRSIALGGAGVDPDWNAWACHDRNRRGQVDQRPETHRDPFGSHGRRVRGLARIQGLIPLELDH